MNRHQRRKAKALRKLGQKGDGAMVVPVHESGHAIAKVLAIGEFGYSIDKAIDYIDIGTGQNLGQSADRKMILQSQAVTVGHTFSKDIETASREFKLAYFAEHGHEVLQGAQNEFLSKIVELGRAAGADIGKWFRARVFDAVSGGLARGSCSGKQAAAGWPNGWGQSHCDNRQSAIRTRLDGDVHRSLGAPQPV